LQQLQQQQIIQHQRQQQAARQALMAQQYSGMPMGVANGMTQMTPAQFAAMRGGPMARSVNLPQHLQQAQQQAQHSLEQQQQAQQHAQQAVCRSFYGPFLSNLSEFGLIFGSINNR
jgi:hypothetical protein